MNILKNRLLLWKKQWLTILFWVILPVLITCIILKMVETVGHDSKIPISIVLEEETPIASAFRDSIGKSPLIRLVELSEAKALNELEKHKLDSVFIVDRDFDQYIIDNRRVSMIDGYQSDLSFAYLPVKELLLSHLQKQSGRSKMVQFVNDMSDAFTPHTKWERDELIETADKIEDGEQLLKTSLTYSNNKQKSDSKPSIVNAWGI